MTTFDRTPEVSQDPRGSARPHREVLVWTQTGICAVSLAAAITTALAGGPISLAVALAGAAAIGGIQVTINVRR
ncbi:hypothetical protein SAMN04487981_10252 [Streptomyces sp. cf386]|nr:hypothetical protein SAMN04487981_10252 [Streptomyces sp. cf386]